MLSVSLFVLSCTDDVADTERDAVETNTAPVLRTPDSDFSMVLSLANAFTSSAIFPGKSIGNKNNMARMDEIVIYDSFKIRKPHFSAWL